MLSAEPVSDEIINFRDYEFKFMGEIKVIHHGSIILKKRFENQSELKQEVKKLIQKVRPDLNQSKSINILFDE